MPSGPDPEQLRVSPDGKLVFVANENDALLTAIDIATRKVVSEFPVGVEPEGVAVSPDGSIVVNTSETTSMAHLIDWQNKKMVAKILDDPRPRYAEYNKDGSELWVTSEVRGTVSVIDRGTSLSRRSCSTGLAKERVSLSASLTRRQAGVRCDGSANRVAVIDAATKKVSNICWSVSASGNWADAGGKVSLVDQWRLNDVSVIDVAA